MKSLLVVVLFAIFASAAVSKTLLGAEKCTWGPSYWCSNITNAAGCHAVKHCIQTVWEHQTLEPDTDTVCQTCLKMVKEARDQLESNETQEEIKEVFEGSCKLIPVKAISSECCKLADEFIPELIDTLASQMNPQMVCSVAGLCNNARVDQLLRLEDEAAPETRAEEVAIKADTCQGCYRVVSILENKFDRLSKDQVLQSFLQVCGRLGSLSDSCSNIVVSYFSEIYKHLQNDFNPTEVCLMAGECSAQFHKHSNVEITPLSNLGFVKIAEEDDLPCDLCSQLVTHLRDLLIANTTRDEFQRVLVGLCKQTKSFQNECLDIVNQYYPVIYEFLVEKLNATAVCTMIGICPNNNNIFDSNVLIAPLLTEEAAAKAIEIMSANKKPLTHVPLSGESTNVRIMQRPENMQLPIERLTPQHLNMMYSRQTCVFCEYFLHYVQEAITNPTTEKKLKQVVAEACSKLPRSVNDTCVQFVDTYGDAFVAILAQEIDPSTVCPLIRACPAENKNVEIFMEAEKDDSKCPLCLFAVTKLEELVKDKETEDNIKNALNSLCSHLSGQVREECQDFVNTYTSELIALLLTDLTPQEVCVYLKLCKDSQPAPTLPPLMRTTPRPTESMLTNKIGDDTIRGIPLQLGNKPNCVLCEFVMSKLDEMLEDKKTEEEIKTVVHGVCNYLPKTVSGQCNDFIDKYADIVITLLVEAMKPSEICAELKFCDPPKHVPEVKSPQCYLCKKILTLAEKVLPKSMTKDGIEKVLQSLCSDLPQSEQNQCHEFMNKYEDKIADLLLALVSPEDICSILLFCNDKIENTKYEIKQCIACEQSTEAMRKVLNNPKADHSKKHVLEKACRALPKKYMKVCNDLTRKRGEEMFKLASELSSNESVCATLNICTSENYVRSRREILLGRHNCSWGPGYWCQELEHAEKCGRGALKHCQIKVWRGLSPKK